MSTIEELGRMMKQQFPDKFSGRSDREVGLELKSLYPSRFLDYRDVRPQTSMPSPPSPGITNESTGIAALANLSSATPVRAERDSGQTLKEIIRSLATVDSQLSHSLETDRLLQYRVENLVDYYKPSLGRFTSWWNRGKSEARDRFLASLVSEQRKLIDQTIMLQQAAHENRARQVELNIFIARNAIELMELKTKASLAEKAETEGMTTSDFSSLNKERQQGDIRMAEYERKAVLDFEIESAKRREAVEFALEHEHLNAHQGIRGVQKLIDDMEKEISDIEHSSNYSQTTKYAMIKDREQILKTYREDRRVREARLLQNNNGQDI